jgi:hypothetical protein
MASGTPTRARHPILVVDADEGVRACLCLAFTTRGYEVEAARSAGEALDKLRRGLDPCLILFDLRMVYDRSKRTGGSDLAGLRLGRVAVSAYSTEIGAGERTGKSISAATLSRLCEVAARHCRRPAPAAERRGRSPRPSRVDPSAAGALHRPGTRRRVARHDVTAGRRKGSSARGLRTSF